VRAAGAGGLACALLGMLLGVWQSVAGRRIDGAEAVDTEETQ